jgi:hypothetical protein
MLERGRNFCGHVLRRNGWESPRPRLANEASTMSSVVITQSAAKIVDGRTYLIPAGSRRHTRHYELDRDDMKPFAQQMGVTPPTKLSPKHQKLYDRLKELSGNEFDKPSVILHCSPNVFGKWIQPASLLHAIDEHVFSSPLLSPLRHLSVGDLLSQVSPAHH